MHQTCAIIGDNIIVWLDDYFEVLNLILNIIANNLIILSYLIAACIILYLQKCMLLGHMSQRAYLSMSNVSIV